MKVACLDLEDALAAFLEWLEVCIQSFLKRKKINPLTNLHPLTQELGGDVVLVAHKCLDYDAKVEMILTVQKLTHTGWFFVLVRPKK